MKLNDVFFWLVVLGIGTYMAYQIVPLIISTFATESQRPRRYTAAGVKEQRSTTPYAPPEVYPDYRFLFATIKDMEEFDALSPDKARQRLAQLAVDMDFNSDGSIDRDELKRWIKGSMRSLVEEAALKRFARIDRNEDGMITWKELYDTTYGQRKGEKRMKSNPEKEMELRRLRAADKEKFDAADINKDGKLNPIEYVPYMAPEEFPQMSNLLLKRVLRSKDTNKDGRIDFQEFVAGDSMNGDDKWLQVEKQRFDMEFDNNGDGYLTETEILAWAVPSSEVLAENEVVLLLETADEDLDASLSYREFITKYHQAIVGKATDSDDRVEEL